MSEVFTNQYEELKDKLITLMAEHISKLTTKVDNIEQELLKYKQNHQADPIVIVDSTPEIEAVQKSQAKKTDALSQNITEISHQISEFRAEIDATKQKLKENNIRLVGLPETHPLEYNDMKTDIVRFSEEHLALHDLSTDDIEEVTRLGKVREDKPRDVLVTFRSKHIRNKFYRQRKNLYDARTMRSTSGIYVNEDLIPYRQRLYYDARNLRKRTVIHSVWTSEGTIIVKLDENSLPKPIITHRDLADLLRERSDLASDSDKQQ